MGRFHTRLRKLECGRVSPETCDGMGNTYLINDDEFDPARVPPCRKCGGQHAVVIEEVVVGPDGREVPAEPNSSGVGT